MKYYKFTADTPYCGTENVYYQEVDDDVADITLGDMAEEFAHDNAESFEYLVFGWDYDPVEEGEMTAEEYEQEMENYYCDCTCTWEEISEEEFKKALGIN